MENKRQNNSNKEISIPFFIPLLIIMIAMYIFVNVSNPNPTVIAATNQVIAETNSRNELETEDILETQEWL